MFRRKSVNNPLLIPKIFKDIGQIIFFLNIIRLKGLERIEQFSAIKNIDAGIDFMNGFFFRRRILLLDNFFYGAAVDCG